LPLVVAFIFIIVINIKVTYHYFSSIVKENPSEMKSEVVRIGKAKVSFKK